ncbi:30S ribosomal protein S6, partial [Durusdinium trenchii]
VPWTESDVQTLAIAVKQSLPLSVIQVLTAPEWSGGRLLQLADDTSRPAANDLILNFYWLKPVAAKFPTTGRTTAKDGDESSEVSEEECEEDQEGDGPEPVADPNEAVEEAGEGGGDEGRVIEDVGASQAHDEGCEGDGESSDGGCAADACLEDGAVDAAVADEGGVGEVVKPDLSDGDSDDEMPPLEAPAEVDSVVLADDSPPPQHKGSGYNEELFQSPQ